MNEILNFSMRKATLEDARLYFEWVNDPQVRLSAFNSEIIEWPSHLKWFNSKIDSNQSELYIFEKDKIAVGQIRFDKISELQYSIDFSIDKMFRGQSLGKSIIRNGIQLLKQTYPNVITLFASVKKDNIASQKSFLSNNFQIVDSDAEKISFQLEK